MNDKQPEQPEQPEQPVNDNVRLYLEGNIKLADYFNKRQEDIHAIALAKQTHQVKMWTMYGTTFVSILQLLLLFITGVQTILDKEQVDKLKQTNQTIQELEQFKSAPE